MKKIEGTMPSYDCEICGDLVKCNVIQDKEKQEVTVRCDKCLPEELK